MSDPRAWADGIILQAMARRHGVPLIVWYHHQQVWLRVCIAAQFSSGYAKLARKTTPIVLVLQNEHYVWLSPPSNQEVPKAWLAEGPLPKPSVLRGGGPRSQSSACTRQAKRAKGSSLPPTPSLHSLDSCPPSQAKEPLGSATPSVHSIGSFAGSGRKGSGTPSLHSLCSSAFGRGRAQGRSSTSRVVGAPATPFLHALQSKALAPPPLPEPAGPESLGSAPEAERDRWELPVWLRQR